MKEIEYEAKLLKYFFPARTPVFTDCVSMCYWVSMIEGADEILKKRGCSNYLHGANDCLFVCFFKIYIEA